MNQIKFFIVSVHRDYIVRFHAQAENLVSEYHNRYPAYLFHVKKIEAYLFCFSIIPPEEADETYLSTYAAELKKSVFSLIPSEYLVLEASNLSETSCKQ